MKFRTALGVSVALHALLGAGIAVCIALAPKPDVLATLDLSSVDISFSEEDDVSAAAVPPRPEPPPEPPPPAVQAPPPMAPDPLPVPLPPDPAAVSAPEPSPEPPKMDTPPRPERSRESPSAETPPPVPAPRQAKVDAPPRPRRTIRPDYPKGSRIRGEQGDVVLEIAVGASGAVERAEVVVSSGYPELDEAAARAAKAAKFEPAKSGGRAVASVARLTLNFRLK